MAGGAWASFSGGTFLASDTSSIVDRLSGHAGAIGFSITPQQSSAWRESIAVLRDSLTRLRKSVDVSGWGVLLEYGIPRRGLRPDAVILAGELILVLEFKVGASRFDRAAAMQVSEYAQDLHDFHHESRGFEIVPVLIAIGASQSRAQLSVAGSMTKVEKIADSRQLVELILERCRGGARQIDIDKWNRSAYSPCPDILSAAREVFNGHEVREISFAYADNLSATVDTIRNEIADAESRSRHVIVFVTGVPGSGKTLAGLSAVHRITRAPGGASEPLGAYLSGNGPLVDVLRYALAKDIQNREGITAAKAEQLSKTFIQRIHDFIREYVDVSLIPPDRVIVFDEAQRAWDSHMMNTQQSINASEPEVVLDAMARVEPWSALVALVGEGQEINRGEAGIGEWVAALKSRPNWDIVISPELANKFESVAGRVKHDSKLHLTVGVRSPRAQAIADWANAVVEGDLSGAAAIAPLFPEYPLLLTRSLEDARSYLRDRVTQDREQFEVDRRMGLLASSQARRLRAFGIEMSTTFQSGINWPQWFVEDHLDVRSSFQLEVAASEFKCQGLEIDWACLCWGDDLLWGLGGDRWTARRLRGARWVRDSDPVQALNRYRVLLTRARYGQIIWVPQPKGHELLTNAKALDRTAEALMQAGVSLLS